jgi:hypothetical protein
MASRTSITTAERTFRAVCEWKKGMKEAPIC